MNNYERIKAMTLDEMAEFFITFIPHFAQDIHYSGIDGKYYKNSRTAIEMGKQWLQAESEG